MRVLLARLAALLIPLGLALPLAAQAPDPSSAPAGEASGVEELPSTAIGTPGDQSLITRFGFYQNGDNGDGNPFLDEALTVIEPVIVFDSIVSETFGYALQLYYDYVSSASIDRLSKFPEQSGASVDNYFGGDLSGRWKVGDDWTVGGHAGYSTEYDYDSIGFGANASRDVAGKDATIGISLNAFYDDIQIIRFDGKEEGNDTRVSFSGTASWYQVISPTLHGSVGLTLSTQSGFLETAYNAVVIEDPLAPPNPNLDNNARGIEITEELPDDRLRIAFFGRARKSLEVGRAVELGGRIYNDDWGITSFAVEPRWYETLIPGELEGMLHYRYYYQTEADYYEEHFFASEEFRTQDSDLAELDSHTLGGRLTWYFGRQNSVSLGFDYVIRSDGLDQIISSIAWETRY